MRLTCWYSLAVGHSKSAAAASVDSVFAKVGVVLDRVELKWRLGNRIYNKIGGKRLMRGVEDEARERQQPGDGSGVVLTLPR